MADVFINDPKSQNTTTNNGVGRHKDNSYCLALSDVYNIMSGFQPPPLAAAFNT